MASITDKPLSEKDEDELCLLQARSFQQGDGQYFLIENILKRRLIEKQHELNKEQIEIQHKLNVKLMNKQLRWMKFSAILNATAILAAVVLGFLLQELKSYIFPKPSAQQSIQGQQEASKKEIPGLHHEIKNDKVILQPSPIKEKHEQNR